MTALEGEDTSMGWSSNTLMASDSNVFGGALQPSLSSSVRVEAEEKAKAEIGCQHKEFHSVGERWYMG